MSATAHVICGVLLLISITVMFGGFSLLRLGLAGRLTPEQSQKFRAGHAHAGVLSVLTILVVDLSDRAGLSSDSLWLLTAALVVSVLAQSGGFFIAIVRQRLGAVITSLGGAALAVTVAGAGVWLLASA
jgi:hypothetical protein